MHCHFSKVTTLRSGHLPVTCYKPKNGVASRTNSDITRNPIPLKNGGSPNTSDT